MPKVMGLVSDIMEIPGNIIYRLSSVNITGREMGKLCCQSWALAEKVSATETLENVIFT